MDPEHAQGGGPRDPETPLTQRHINLAASVQKVTEEVILRITRNLAKTYAVENLCLAGGVAPNCVANGKVLRDASFKHIWIQPAAGDAAARSARRSRLITSISTARAKRTGLRTLCKAPTLAHSSPNRKIEKRLAIPRCKKR